MTREQGEWVTEYLYQRRQYAGTEEARTVLAAFLAYFQRFDPRFDAGAFLEAVRDHSGLTP